MSDVTRGDKVITGNLYIGGEILNSALTTTIQAAFPLYDALTYKGVIASLATFPAASKGDLYKCTATGSIGGTGPTVAVGDIVICNTDSTSAGTYAVVGTKWDIIPTTNIDTLDDLIAATAESDFITSGSTPFAWAKRTLAATKTILGLAGIVPAGTAEHDFIVAGSTPFTWAKQTLAQVKTILGLGTAAYTAATAYVTHALATAEDDFLVASGVGVWAKQTLAQVKTTLGLGTAAYTDTGAYDAAGTAAAVIASSISDADLTHCPDGNSVFDALALKADLASMSPDILALKEKTPVNAVASAAKLTSSGAMAPATHATSVLLSGGANVTDGKIVTIGTTVYRFKATTLAAYDIKIGTNAAETLDFLKAAINATGTGDGTDYHAGTLAHPDVVATTNTDTEQTIQAKVPGADANSIVTTDDDADLSWGDTTLGGGTGDSTPGVTAAAATVTIGTRVYTFVDELSEDEADAIADQVLYGGSVAAALDNLKLAIDAGATAGTNYSTGTVVNADVSGGTNTNTTQVFTAKVKGVVGHLIAFATTCANMAVDAAVFGTETAGVDGTVGVANETCADASYIYHCVAANTTADTNWRRVDLGSAF